MKAKERPTAAPEEGAVQVHVETPRAMPALSSAAAPSAAPPAPPKPIPLLGVAPSILVSERKPSGVAPRAMWLGLHVLGLFLLWVEGAWPAGWPFLVVIATTFVFYSGASFTDPGFVSEQASHGPGDTLGEMLLAQPVCVLCQAPQPKRAKHCYTCARCVHRLDHHCLWLGNCVGEGNHRLFVAYLAAQAVLLGWAAVASAMTLVTGDTAGFGDDGTVIQTPLPLWRCLAGLGCCALSSLLFLAVLTLVSFQVLLVVRGETTWENLRRAKINEADQLPPDARPYDRGVWRNLLIFCQCEPDPSSTLRRRPTHSLSAEEAARKIVMSKSARNV